MSDRLESVNRHVATAHGGITALSEYFEGMLGNDSAIAAATRASEAATQEYADSLRSDGVDLFVCFIDLAGAIKQFASGAVSFVKSLEGSGGRVTASFTGLAVDSAAVGKNVAESVKHGANASSGAADDPAIAALDALGRVTEVVRTGMTDLQRFVVQGNQLLTLHLANEAQAILAAALNKLANIDTTSPEGAELLARATETSRRFESLANRLDAQAQTLGALQAARKSGPLEGLERGRPARGVFDELARDASLRSQTRVVVHTRLEVRTLDPQGERMPYRYELHTTNVEARRRWREELPTLGASADGSIISADVARALTSAGVARIELPPVDAHVVGDVGETTVPLARYLADPGAYIESVRKTTDSGSR